MSGQAFAVGTASGSSSAAESAERPRRARRARDGGGEPVGVGAGFRREFTARSARLGRASGISYRKRRTSSGPLKRRCEIVGLSGSACENSGLPDSTTTAQPGRRMSARPTSR